MPSAARQKLPADLWRQGQRKLSSVSFSSYFPNQDIQANPGQLDVTEEKQRPCTPRFILKGKKPFNGRGSPRILKRGGSSDTLSMVALSDSEISDGKDSTTILSRSVESDSCLSFSPSKIYNAYAMESSIAPHPSQLPFPPLEWLQSSLLASCPTAGISLSLEGLVSCQVSA